MKKCVHFGPAWASGAGGAGSDCRFKGFRLGATGEMKTNVSVCAIMKKMRSSREVILPKMSFRLGATAEMKRNAFFLLIYEGDVFVSVRLCPAWASGAGGAGSDCRFKGFRLGATTEHE